MVIRIGFEPMTYCLEGSCSIQLSYRTNLTLSPLKVLFNRYALRLIVILLSSLSKRESNVLYTSVIAFSRSLF